MLAFIPTTTPPERRKTITTVIIIVNSSKHYARLIKCVKYHPKSVTYISSILKTPNEVGPITPILYMRKLKHRENERSKEQNTDYVYKVS